MLAVLMLAAPLRADAAGGSGATDLPEVPAAEAGRHVGEVVRVCGFVAGAAHIASVSGKPTFLNMGRAYPDQDFTAVVWGRVRSRFETPPERLYDGKTICVTGKVELYKGKPQITVESPDQISLRDPATAGAGTDAATLTDLERTMVKAVLASLGYDANYGSAEWDQATAEAVVAFQEASGLPPTGEPDAETLRAMAAGVVGIPEGDRSLVIQLFLLELVRRRS
jgi:hypothetical protein